MTQKKQDQDRESQEWGIKGMTWGNKKVTPDADERKRLTGQRIWEKRQTLPFDKIPEDMRKKSLDYLDQADKENKAGNGGGAQDYMNRAEHCFPLKMLYPNVKIPGVD